MSESPPSSGSDQELDVTRTLVAAVRRAILERLMDDLDRERAKGLTDVGYTRSAAGIYGKYEKQDDPNNQLVGIIRTVLEDILDEYESRAVEHHPDDDDEHT